MNLFKSKKGTVKENALNARVKVLGSGCKKCNELEATVKEALLALGKEPVVEHVTDFAKIAAYGAMSMPALVIDEKLVSSGKILTKQEAMNIIEEANI